jgi:hypothetical protein
LIEYASHRIAQSAVLAWAGALQALVIGSSLAALLDQCVDGIGHAAELTTVAMTLDDLKLGLRRARILPSWFTG